MGKGKTIYTDRDYLEARFASTDEKLDKILEVVGRQGQQIINLEKDVGGAKLLGRVALGVAACIGAFTTWALDMAQKAAFLVPHR
jgi:hypothetical protein